jgi:hypothetical protein
MESLIHCDGYFNSILVRQGAKASDKVSAGTANLRLPGEGQFF